MKKYLFGLLYGLFLTAFTTYVLLDTFVIARVSQTIPPPSETPSLETVDRIESTPSTTGGADTTDKQEPPKPEDKQELVQTDTAYSDGKISVTLTEYRIFSTVVYVADVKISSPDYLKTALAKNSFGRNVKQKTSVMAEEHNAILAINGDYYGAREKGYVLRNGVSYREEGEKGRDALVIYEDGSLDIVSETVTPVKELAAKGARQILSFGPGLLKNSEILVDKDSEVPNERTSNPRTAIGIVEDLHYVFVVSEGRTEESKGLTLLELAQVMEALGATTAYNLDGGGSATMVFNGKVINMTTTNGTTVKEREVSDCVYIGY